MTNKSEREQLRALLSAEERSNGKTERYLDFLQARPAVKASFLEMRRGSKS